MYLLNLALLTKCVFREIDALKEKLPSGVFEAAKALKKEECGHTKGTSAPECLAQYLGSDNEAKYLLATQDDALKARVRQIPGVPVLGYLKSVLTLEEPTDLSYQLSTQVTPSQLEETKLWEDAQQNEGVMEMIERAREEQEEEERTEFETLLHSKEANKFREIANKKRKAKGPNPLSALKKHRKLEEGERTEDLGERKKRTRRRRKDKQNISS